MPKRRAFRPTIDVLAVLAALMWLGAAPLQAQTPPAPQAAPQQTAEAPAAQPEPVPEDAAAKLADEELDALVARIALYPDPLLAVVLQAATLPLELVEAERFLEKRAKNSKAEPKKEWDPSITALLNYSSVVKMMSDDLDWTQTLGDAVLNQLGDVQDSVQQFRAEVQAAGLLRTDDKQTVTVEGDTIKIEPAQPQVIYVPMYDGAALAAALAAQPAPPAAPQGGAPAPAAQPAAPASDQAAALAPAPAAAAPAAAGTTVVYPPAYPSAYPPPTYSQPYPSFWTPAASFVGGAVVGGMLGYAIGDDNDDIEVYHHGDGYGGGRNVSGNKVVSGNTVNVAAPNVNRRETNNQTQAALRERSGGQTSANSARAREARAQVNRGGAVAPAAGTRAASASRAAPQRTADRRDAAPPQRDQASGAAGDRAREAHKPGAAPGGRGDAGALSDVKSGRDTRKESARGAESRAAAQSKAASATPQQRQAAAQRAQQQPQREAAAGAPRERRNQASGGALASQGGGQRAAQQADRGAHSRGGGGGGRHR